jgi:hypothetical protein
MTIPKFIQSGMFHAGDFLSIDLDKISQFQISRQRNSCDLLATTPENPPAGHAIYDRTKGQRVPVTGNHKGTPAAATGT